MHHPLDVLDAAKVRDDKLDKLFWRDSYAHPSSCHAGVCHVAEGFCVTAAGLPEASRFPTGRMSMDEVEFHREPPSNLPTLVTAFTGWIDAGEAATDALRFLVRQLAAEPLATIDLEDFVDFTQDRPVVRLTAAGERTIRWPRSAFWLWQPPAPRAGLLLFRGLEPQRRWRTYATTLLGVAARCGVQRLVSLGQCSWTCPIPGPHASRAAAPTLTGMPSWRRGGWRGARATKAPPVLRVSCWTR